MVEIQTSRFGALSFQDTDIITFAEGPLGFESHLRFSIVDPGDQTQILWLQSLTDGSIAFPILEPKIFEPNFTLCLTPKDMSFIEVNHVNECNAFSILTIPADITKMNANLKAPIVINPTKKIAKQIVMQDSKLPLDMEIYKILKSYIIKTNQEKIQTQNTDSTIEA